MSAAARNPFDAFVGRLAACFRMLLSTNEGERNAGAAGAQRMLLNAKGIDLHEVAARLEKPSGLNEDQKKQIRAAIEEARKDGYAEGVRAAEKRVSFNTAGFSSTDGSDEWKAVALYVQREKQRLPAQHHQFVDDMASRTVWNHDPSPRQHKYLHSLFLKLGGKIT